MGPIYGTTDITMLNRIVVNVINVIGLILFIANQMLPITALPNASFTLLFSAGIDHNLNIDCEKSNIKKSLNLLGCALLTPTC